MQPCMHVSGTHVTAFSPACMDACMHACMNVCVHKVIYTQVCTPMHARAWHTDASVSSRMAARRPASGRAASPAARCVHSVAAYS
eukprot:364409-Chlamydomonas_euryale.AAC.3